MDKLELVNKLRTGAFLARVTIRAPAKGNEGVPDDTYTKLASAQRDVRDTLQTRSVAFGDKRLVFNEDFLDMVHTMGQPMSDFIALLATLPDDKRALFAIDRAYEPVPAPDGFGLLPEAVTTSLARHVEDRVCKLYYAGLDDTVARLHAAVDYFIKRVTEYHATQGSGTRAVMRAVVLTDVVDLRALLARTNLVNSPAINDLDAALAGAVQYSADEIRKSPEKRIAALDAAKAAQQQLAAYKGA